MSIKVLMLMEKRSICRGGN